MAGTRSSKRVDLADGDKPRCIVIACFCDSGDVVDVDVLERPQVRTILASRVTFFGLLQVVVTKGEDEMASLYMTAPSLRGKPLSLEHPRCDSSWQSAHHIFPYLIDDLCRKGQRLCCSWKKSQYLLCP